MDVPIPLTPDGWSLAARGKGRSIGAQNALTRPAQGGPVNTVSSPNGRRPLAAVTGASSGIGYELARQFCTHGFDVIAIAEDAGLTQAAQSLASNGATVTPVQADLRYYD